MMVISEVPQAGNSAAPAKVNLAYIVMIAVAAALGGLMFGFDVAIITGAGPFIERQFNLDALGLGWAFSSLLFGCGVGAALSGMLVDLVGRKTLMVMVAALFGVTTVVTGLAQTFDTFVFARFLGGLAVGAVSLVAPMYVSEVTPATLRGRMGALYQMAIVTGILGSYLINYLLHDAGPEAWRYMFFTGAVPAALYLALVLSVPESPRFLIRKGREAEARAILARIGGEDPQWGRRYRAQVPGRGPGGVARPGQAACPAAGGHQLLPGHPYPPQRHQHDHRLCAEDLQIRRLLTGCRPVLDLVSSVSPTSPLPWSRSG